ncbi:MAG: amidohydrolase family protein [Eudoraea sp.]|uniref:amidohydrolase family protein n=1 Tax=Eudoraea sp. TaxID=1979955 RepID=UPI0032642ACB
MTRILIIALSLFCTQILAQSDPQKLLIKNITIISANNGGVTSQVGHVVIADEKINYVGTKKPKKSTLYEVIDGRGKFLIPGLIDSHVHLANTAGFNGSLKSKYPELMQLYFEQLPRSYLYFGFTTLIDVNNYHPKLINQLLDANIRPDIYTCGEQVVVMDDFNMEMEGYSSQERYDSNFLNDTYNSKINLPDTISPNEHTPQKIIENIREQSGICAKLVYEDEASGLAVSWSKPSTEILRDLIAEAQKFQLPLILHAPSLEGHQIGLETGIQIFAHGLWNWSADPKDFRNRDLSEAHKQVLLQIAHNDDIAYQLTFRTITGEQDLISADFLKDKNLEHVYPKSYMDLLKTEEGQWGKNKIFGRSEFLKKTNPEFYNALRANHTDDQKMWEKAFEIYRHRLNTVARFLAQNNANLILGTDTPAMNMYTNPPGYNGIMEIRHWYEAGIPLERIFSGATFNNAAAFNLQNLYGSVEKEKIANLLILNSNPLLNVEAYNDIDMVIIRGDLIERNQLSAAEY